MILVDVQDDDLARALERAAMDADSPQAAFAEIKRSWERSVRANFRAGGRPKKWPNKRDGSRSTLQRSGRLQASIRGRTLKDGVQIGSRAKHARLHQDGGEVRARRRRYLSIPLPDTPKTMAAAGAGALFRRYPDRAFTLFKNGKGTVLLAPPDGEGAPKAMFILRRKVTVKPRPFLLAQPEDLREWEQILLRHATGGLA